MLLKKKAYDLTKGFDEKLWFHMVDIEWCKRLNKNGLKIWFTPSIEVIHLGGASSKGLSFKLLKDNFEGIMHYFKKHYPKSLGYVAFSLRIGLQFRALYYLFARNLDLAKNYNHISKAIKATSLHLFILIDSIPLEV